MGVVDLVVLDRLLRATSKKRSSSFFEEKMHLRQNSGYAYVRKSHMGFPLVPKSVTLSDLETTYWPLFCAISPIVVASKNQLRQTVKVVEVSPIHTYCLQQKCIPKNLLPAIYDLW